MLTEVPPLATADAFLTMAPASGSAITASPAASTSSAAPPSDEYLKTLLLYFEEEVEGISPLRNPSVACDV